MVGFLENGALRKINKLSGDRKEAKDEKLHY